MYVCMYVSVRTHRSDVCACMYLSIYKYTHMYTVCIRHRASPCAVRSDRESSLPNARVVFLCPVVFTLAHVHHVYERRRQGMALSAAALATLVQASYTSVFGAVATLLLTRTGSLVAPVLAHVVCNAIGLPHLGFMAEPGPDGSEYSFMHAHRHALLALHLLGLVAFACALFPLTERLALHSPLWVS